MCLDDDDETLKWRAARERRYFIVGLSPVPKRYHGSSSTVVFSGVKEDDNNTEEEERALRDR